jgi:hypothetical protein
MKIYLNKCKAGELAALYILTMRGICDDYAPAEIQDALESLVGDLMAIDNIRQVRSTIDVC